MEKIGSNRVSLAGEFAVLSRLALENFDANLTLGNTKGVDILVSSSKGRLARLEVKTNFGKGNSGGSRDLFGNYLFSWMMSVKNEELFDKDLFYCFVNIGTDKRTVRCFVVPSKIVADYVKAQHKLWLDGKETRSRTTTMRTFRIGSKGNKYKVATPLIENHEDKWSLLS
jgi:hypothetical protein